jgi:hypothetical protein
VAAAAAIVTAAVTAAITVAIVTSPNDGPTAIDERVAELEAQEAERNLERIDSLTQTTVAAHDELLPVMDQLHAILPLGGSPAQPASRDDVAALQASVSSAFEMFGSPESASTEVNVARGGFVLAVELLAASLTAYEAALDAGFDAGFETGGAGGSQLVEMAADLRMSAVDAWSVAATQLDVLNIDAENGHVHLYLPARPGEDTEVHH